ncbi:MAG: hypothetical protein WCY97_08545 [Methanothrix sp.]|jgi:hypothetical protein|uniref:Uncharacterized protein n=1 Tax=Methanothrix harundinacea TaxID=301375 RepID=A0A101FSD5_9EURY|nr:MAG: hypothetical protein XD72_2122 [Methanothrix harundinacea]MDD3709625.1 hypothetical protein [Methanothrix sp.]MDI9399058.1 hypothetical protein [Euryarchaeota archaeon]KUK95072.1 MAG: hypothetical protein XE07_1936 [Methanothrix harundinacea]MCP1392140.1 hypothetical protein [Methanothrix harundinacea]
MAIYGDDVRRLAFPDIRRLLRFQDGIEHGDLRGGIAIVRDLVPMIGGSSAVPWWKLEKV